MIDERKQHLELVAAGLMQAYYSVPRSGSPDHREILETYLFLLDALTEHNSQRRGETPLISGSPFEGEAP